MNTPVLFTSDSVKVLFIQLWFVACDLNWGKYKFQLEVDQKKDIIFPIHVQFGFSGAHVNKLSWEMRASPEFSHK